MQTGPLKYAALVLLIVLYVAVRLWGLTGSCLWFDEIFSIHAAEHDIGSLFSFVALDLIHPPLFYVLLKLWIAAGGEGLLWLRLFPVVFSVIAVIPFILLCRELKLPVWTQTLALLLFAANGSLIKYAQEVRMYSLLLCVSLFSIWLFARYVSRGRGYIPLLLVNLVLVYTHYFGWFVVFAEVVAILLWQRDKWRRAIAMAGVTMVVFLPWLIAVCRAAVSGSDVGQNIGWMSRPGPAAIGNFVLSLVDPFYYQTTSAEPSAMFKVAIPILLLIGVAIAFYSVKWGRQTADERATVKFLLLFAGVPLAVVFVLSLVLPYSIWGTRHMIIMFGPCLILFAIAISKISTAWLRTSLMTLLVLFNIYALAIEARRPANMAVWCGFEAVGKQIEKTSSGPVYVFEDLAAYHLWFSFRDTRGQKEWMQVVKVTGFEGMTEDPAYFLPRGFEDVQRLEAGKLFNDGPRWIVYRAQTLDPAKPPLNTFLARGFAIVDQRQYEAAGSSVLGVLLERK